MFKNRKRLCKKIASSHRVKSEKVVSEDLIKHPPCAALVQVYERTYDQVDKLSQVTFQRDVLC